MSLAEQLKEDLKKAMKAGDSERVGVLRLLTNAVHNKEIEKQSRGKGGTMTQEEMIQVLMSEAKKRKEAIEVFTKGGRGDLAQKEKLEMEIIQNYLPKQMDAAEVEKIVAELLKKSGAADFSSAMKEAMKELKGKADAGVVSEVVKKLVGHGRG